MNKSNLTGGGYNENPVPSSEKRNWELVNFCEFDKYATKSYCAIHNVDENLNLGDITKVDETKLKPFNMICGGSPCFTEGTKVYTNKGYKNIEDICVGDLVLTHRNRFMPVVATGGEKQKDIYSLRVQGFLETKCTDYHPFYCKKTRSSAPEKIRLRDIKKGYYIGSHINKESDNKFNLSNEDCWILGRYVADGHIRKDKRKGRIGSYQYQCILSIGNNKVDELKRNVKNRHYSCYPHGGSVHRAVFSSMDLVDFIIDNGFGTKAETKTIPKFILDLPIDKLRSFIDGYMSGDGCEIDGKYQTTTISKELAMSLCLAVEKVFRVGCRIYYDERQKHYEIQGRVVNQKDTYMIRFMKESQKQAWFIEEDIVWYPVKSIKPLNRKEDVFNIEVQDDHTYTANNMITFNCQDFSVAGKQKGSVWTCKDCGHEYNPLTVHWSHRDRCPECNSNNIEKTRSSLLVEYLRIIRANKPNFGIYENVKNIVGKKFINTTFKMFEDELHEYGYNTYWKVLNAKNYGIPQNRERVYLIFIRKDLDNGQFKFPEPFDNGIRLKDILEDEVDERFYLSDDKVQKFLSNFSQSKLPVTTRNSDTVSTIRATYYKNGERNVCENIENGNGYEGVVESNNVKQIGNISEGNSSWGNPQTGRIYSADGISPTLNTCGGGQREPKIVTGLASNYGENFEKETDISNTLQARDYKGFGKQTMNVVIKIPQATKQGYIECEVGGVADLSYPNSKTRRGRVQENRTISPTITATETGICRIEKADGCYTNQSPSFTRAPLEGLSRTLKADSHPAGVYDGIRIRKLTPRECFRLMGFSDQNFDAAKNAGISKSQLYKQAGNSIVVDVLYYIYVELYKAMPYLFENLKLSSFFSGIGAFESALDRLYKGINSGNFINPQGE